jgi:hypothetical protein
VLASKKEEIVIKRYQTINNNKSKINGLFLQPNFLKLKKIKKY